MSEQRETFECFGSECTLIVSDAARPLQAAQGLADAKHRLLDWHGQFSRFEHDSELSRLNADARSTVPVTPLMRRVIEQAVRAAERTGGLVDPTLMTELEQAGYDRHFDGPGVEVAPLLACAPERAAASASPAARWRAVEVDRAAGTVTRPPGVKLDPGGIAKGLFADELFAAMLDRHDAFVVDCAGDIRLGGRAGTPRAVHVSSPFDGSVLHTFELASGGVATSGIMKRSWHGAGGASAHHLLDPATGQPAFTGVVQVTALAPTASEAEALSKAALLSGPSGAADWLAHGGVVVLEDGSVVTIGSA